MKLRLPLILHHQMRPHSFELWEKARKGTARINICSWYHKSNQLSCLPVLLGSLRLCESYLTACHLQTQRTLNTQICTDYISKLLYIQTFKMIGPKISNLVSVHKSPLTGRGTQRTKNHPGYCSHTIESFFAVTGFNGLNERIKHK